MEASIISIQIGKPRLLGTPHAPRIMDRTWRSAIYKETVDAPVWAGRMGLDGDGQADEKHHGGLDQAVYLYPVEHYPFWRALLEQDDLPYGSFGENLSTQGILEADVCIGDVFSVGNVVLQVTVPRVPCWKLARRFRRSDVPKRMQKHGCLGWYFRVLEEGWLQSSMKLTLAERPAPDCSIVDLVKVIQNGGANPAAVRKLADCPALLPSWRERLAEKLPV